LGQASRLLLMLLTLALLALAGAARAQSNPGIFNLKGSDGFYAAYIDGSGNLALRGALVQNDQAIAATAASEWTFRQSASVVLARISLAGSAVGELRLRGALYQNATPQAAHPFRVKNNAGVVVASIDASGNLYLKGTSLAGAANPLQTALAAPHPRFCLGAQNRNKGAKSGNRCSPVSNKRWRIGIDTEHEHEDAPLIALSGSWQRGAEADEDVRAPREMQSAIPSPISPLRPVAYRAALR
jgi:hypothetical protein